MTEVGEADQRARLGHDDVAKHREARGDTAGVGSVRIEMYGSPPRPAARARPTSWPSASARGYLSCIRAPPEAETIRTGRCCRWRARSRGRASRRRPNHAAPRSRTRTRRARRLAARSTRYRRRPPRRSTFLGRRRRTRSRYFLAVLEVSGSVVVSPVSRSSNDPARPWLIRSRAEMRNG